MDSIRKNTINYEILVHDNSPPNPNLGFARANNLLIRKAKGDYIVLLNPDTWVTEGWLERLIETAESDSRIGIVQPKTLRPNGLLDSTGHRYTRIWGVYMPGDRGAEEVDRGQYDGLTELKTCTFAAALVKRRVFESIGLLDERMFLYCEDMEFCLRARKAGWRVVYSPKSLVYHVRHGSASRVVKISPWQAYFAYIQLKYFGIMPFLAFILTTILRMPAGISGKDAAYLMKKLAIIPRAKRMIS
ncbi:glycosyltransferase family 2 protein [Candidatus Bathyarchaeota archaeon]|nr:glycosyltransferase family 2 protein [Candidatus Bathyarchaeota archaeon]